MEENNLFKFLMRRILNQKSIAMMDSILLHVFTLAIESVFRLSITPLAYAVMSVSTQTEFFEDIHTYRVKSMRLKKSVQLPESRTTTVALQTIRV